MIRAVAIDLDDTLIDTTGLLVPAAAEAACRAMITEGGLPEDLATCLAWRAELAPQHSHREIFPLIARRAGAPDPVRCGDLGSALFYNPPVPSPLELLPGAAQVLADWPPGVQRFLVTSGAPETQWRKVRAAGLLDSFTAIYVINKFNGESKTAAFQRILSCTGLNPSQLLSIGNRLKEEIRCAKELGAQTCYFRYGEHLGEQPERPGDRPDFTIDSWTEFRATCPI